MRITPKHIFFRIVGHKLFKPTCFALLGLWIYQHIFLAKAPVADPSTYQNATHLSDVEMEYYTQHFNYVMNTGKDGEASAWETYSSKGSITPAAPFKSKVGATCRPFTESYTVGTRSGEAKGFACQYKQEKSWCKLKPDAMQSCVLEPPKTALGRALRDSSQAVDSAKLWVKGTIDFW